MQTGGGPRCLRRRREKTQRHEGREHREPGRLHPGDEGPQGRHVPGRQTGYARQVRQMHEGHGTGHREHGGGLRTAIHQQLPPRPDIHIRVPRGHRQRDGRSHTRGVLLQKAFHSQLLIEEHAPHHMSQLQGDGGRRQGHRVLPRMRKGHAHSLSSLRDHAAVHVPQLHKMRIRVRGGIQGGTPRKTGDHGPPGRGRRRRSRGQIRLHAGKVPRIHREQRPVGQDRQGLLRLQKGPGQDRQRLPHKEPVRSEDDRRKCQDPIS